jgi:hypothetical protein
MCQRYLSRDEAVYRVRIGYGSGVSIFVACSQCAREWDREWYPAKPCCNCQRPTFVDHHRNGLRFFVCSSHCRWAVEYARRHRRPDARACAVCVRSSRRSQEWPILLAGMQAPCLSRSNEGQEVADPCALAASARRISENRTHSKPLWHGESADNGLSTSRRNRLETVTA